MSKKNIYLLVVLLLSFGGQTLSQKKIAILEPTTTSGDLKPSYLVMVGSQLETGVINNPDYIAFNRAQLDAVMKEHKFQRSGLVKDDDIRRLGQMAGVDYVLTSEVAFFEEKENSTLFVTAKILNIETGKYELSECELMDFNSEAICVGCQILAYKILHDGSTVGMPVHLLKNGNSVVGRNQGLSQPQKEVAVTDNLCAYYTFDKGTGSDHQKQYDGNIVGNALFIDETINGYGKALQLKGASNHRFVVPYTMSGNSFTVAFWAKDITTGLLFSLQINNKVQIALELTSDTKLSLTQVSQCNYFAYNVREIMSSGWHHVALVIDGKTVLLYVDGSLKDQLQLNNLRINGKILFGGGFVNKSNANMKIDNIRIYCHHGLSRDEIQKIYQSEKK